MTIDYRTYDLRFRHPFTISKGTKTHQPTLIVCLQAFGLSGWGEAPAINYYGVTTESMVPILEQKRTALERFAFTEPDRWWHFLHHLLPNDPFLVCALDIAGWDLFAKLQKVSLASLMPFLPKPIPTDCTIGIDTIERMGEKLKQTPASTYKIKLGTTQDIEIVTALRAFTDKPFRVDANAAWTVAEALEKLPKLAALGVTLVEQPLAKEDWPGMQQLMAVSTLPLIADESCVAEADVAKCAGYFHGINIKLTKCSGITPALRMIQNARRLSLQVMLGSMNESSVGTAALHALSGGADHLDADGPLLLAQDLAEGLTIDADGAIRVDGPLGLGIRFMDLFDKV